MGVYYPWLDYKWGFPTGVPVKNPMTTDVVSFTFPMQMLAVDLIKSGQWPLWNPYILAGAPLLANFQSAPFSPTNFVYFVFDRLTGWSVQIILQHFLAGLFTYLLLRHWNVSKLGSLLGGVGFAFGGFNTIWSQWNGHTLSAAFISLLLLFFDRWFKNGKVRDAVLFSVVVAFQILSGYPQVVLYTAVAVFILWAVNFHYSREFFLKTLIIFVFGILGVGAAAFQILPGRELLGLSQREVEAHPFEWAFLPFIKLITFFAPDFYGNHSTQNWWGPQDYTSNTGFVGVVAFVFASMGIVFLKKMREVLFLVVLLVVSLLLSFPTPVSILFWKTGFLGLQAASAHRGLVLFNLSVALLAGFGVDRFINEKNLKTYKYFIFPGVVLFAFGAVTLVLFRFGGLEPTADIYNLFTNEKEDYRVGLKNLVIPCFVFASSLISLWWVGKRGNLKLWGVIFVFVLMVFELFRFFGKFTPFSPSHIVFPTTPILDFLSSQERPFRTTGSRVIPINMRMPYKIEALEGYDAVYPLQMSQFVAAVTSGKSGTRPVGRYGTLGDETARILDLVNVKYILAVKKDERNNPSPDGKISPEFDPELFQIVKKDKSTVILENKDVLPRAFMVYDWEISEGPKTLDKLMEHGFPFNKKVFLEKDPGVLLGGDGKGEVSYETYKETENILRVKSSDDGILFISDTFYPGWRAFVDGRETKILKTDFAFRGVVVPKGEHEVRFVYRPSSFFNGLKISFISLLLLAGFGAVFKFAKGLAAKLGVNI